MEDIKPDIGIKMDGIEPYIGIKMKGLEPDIGIKMESVKPNIGIKVEAVKPIISTESPNPDVSIKMEAVKPNISIESPNPDVGIKMQESDCWPEVMTFTPTMEEFSSLKNLLAFMESKGAHKAGIAKIKPPGEWIARSKGYQVRKKSFGRVSDFRERGDVGEAAGWVRGRKGFILSSNFMQIFF